jgi:hypothetical protein
MQSRERHRVVAGNRDFDGPTQLPASRARHSAELFAMGCETQPSLVRGRGGGSPQGYAIGACGRRPVGTSKAIPDQPERLRLGNASLASSGACSFRGNDSPTRKCKGVNSIVAGPNPTDIVRPARVRRTAYRFGSAPHDGPLAGSAPLLTQRDANAARELVRQKAAMSNRLDSIQCTARLPIPPHQLYSGSQAMPGSRSSLSKASEDTPERSNVIARPPVGGVNTSPPNPWSSVLVIPWSDPPKNNRSTPPP